MRQKEQGPNLQLLISSGSPASVQKVGGFLEEDVERRVMERKEEEEEEEQRK